MPVPAAPSPPVAPPSTCASSSLVPTGLAMGYLMTVQGAGEREEAFDRCTFRACRSPRSDEGHGSRQSGGRCSISWALHAVIDSVVCCLALRHSGVVPETLPAHGAARSRRAAPLACWAAGVALRLRTHGAAHSHRERWAARAFQDGHTFGRSGGLCVLCVLRRPLGLCARAAWLRAGARRPLRTCCC